MISKKDWTVQKKLARIDFNHSKSLGKFNTVKNIFPLSKWFTLRTNQNSDKDERNYV